MIFRAENIFKQQNFQEFLRQNNIYLNDHQQSLIFSNIKFLLNIQINTLKTKHIKQILVILFKSQ